MAAAQLLDGEDAEMPNEETVRGCPSLIVVRAAAVGAPFQPTVGATDGLDRVRYGGKCVMRIPNGYKSIQTRLLACEHMQEADHSRVTAKLAGLWTTCVEWNGQSPPCRQPGWLVGIAAVGAYVAWCKGDSLFLGRSEVVRGTDEPHRYTNVQMALEDVKHVCS